MNTTSLFRLDVAIADLPYLLLAALRTVPIALAAFGVALVLGAILLMARRSRLVLISYPAFVFFDFIRSTPLLLQTYFFFFVLPEFDIRLTAVETGIVALGLHYACHVSEVYRAGIETVPAGQWDTVRALGFSRFDSLTRLIVPQILPYLLPALGNLLVSIFKETPILAAIAVADTMFVAMQRAAESFRYIEPITVAGLIFLMISICGSAVVRLVANFAQDKWFKQGYADV